MSNEEVQEPRCAICGKRPEEIDEYIEAAEDENDVHDYCNEPRITPADYVRREEGTYNPESFQFFCTDCYIRIGCPNGKAP